MFGGLLNRFRPKRSTASSPSLKPNLTRATRLILKFLQARLQLAESRMGLARVETRATFVRFCILT